MKWIVMLINAIRNVRRLELDQRENRAQLNRTVTPQELHRILLQEKTNQWLNAEHVVVRHWEGVFIECNMKCVKN